MNINISNANGEPIYLQIASQIKTLILEGKLREGEALPSMRVLATELRISFMTTKRAYEELERDGFIESYTGKGSFVKAQNLELYREEQIKRLEALLAEAGEAVNLEDAKVIVTGGRGMGSEENYELCEELADVLGGVVGATRPVIENGWISRTHQVGQSGKIVAPDLYIACGVSGATQHVSGMSGSKYIIAINKDEEAPIFSVADLGIVGDVKQVLPILIEEFKKIKA